MLDYYAILEVSSSASTSEIKKSYRRLARLHHPDLNQDARDTQIKRLNEAYEVLRDPKKRAAYDMQRREKQQQAQAAFVQQPAAGQARTKNDMGRRNYWLCQRIKKGVERRVMSMVAICALSRHSLMQYTAHHSTRQQFAPTSYDLYTC